MNISLGELVQSKQQLLFIDSNTKIEDAAQFLKEHDILGAPVYDEAQKKFVGMIDTFELMVFTGLGCLGDKVYRDPEFQEVIFPNRKVGERVQMSHRMQRVIEMRASDPLSEAIKELGTHEKRVLVSFGNPEEKDLSRYKILTQMDIVRYCQKTSLLDKIDETVKDACPQLAEPDYAKSLVCVSDKDNALKGFLEMADEEVNAVAVLDDKGAIRANLSASELRGITQESLPFVMQPVLHFLETLSGKKPVSPITCQPEDKLRDVVKKTLENNVHRVWITDKQRKPVGVVTLTDVIRQLRKFLTE